jgi:hypothetical protein
MDGEKDEAWCPACRTRFSRGGVGGRIRIEEASGETWEVPTRALTSWPEEPAALTPDGPREDGSWSHRAAVEVRRAEVEQPFHFRGELLGFAEVFGPASEGVLEINEAALVLRTAGEAKEEEDRWSLMEVRAVQTSSSSLQFACGDGSLIQFRFQEDSPRRWESLLRGALKAIYRKKGLGEIVEFQPRIVAEP